MEYYPTSCHQFNPTLDPINQFEAFSQSKYLHEKCHTTWSDRQEGFPSCGPQFNVSFSSEAELTCMSSKLAAYTYIPLTGFQVVNWTDVV